MVPDDLPPSRKYVWDRKRHVLVYSIGFVLFVTSSGAIVQDRAAVLDLLAGNYGSIYAADNPAHPAQTAARFTTIKRAAG